MEADIAEVGNWLGSYLRTPKEEYKLRVLDDTQDFWEAFNQFESLRLTGEERARAVELEDLFSQTQALSTAVIALEDDIEVNLAEFVELRIKLDAILDDDIQVLTHQDLAEASPVAHQMESRTNILVLLLLLVGLACGTIVAVGITRGITGPVVKLVSANQGIARGDLSQRVDVRSKDEFGILGESFNEMIHQRQQAKETLRHAHDQLELQVEDRTANLVKTNKELQQTRDLALEATQAKSVFLANKSHELRTPLNAIIGYTEMLQEQVEEMDLAECAGDLSKVQEAGHHLLDLISDVLDLSRIEAGGMEINPETLNISELVNDVVAVIHPLVEDNANTLKVNWPRNVGSRWAGKPRCGRPCLTC